MTREESEWFVTGMRAAARLVRSHKTSNDAWVLQSEQAERSACAIEFEAKRVLERLTTPVSIEDLVRETVEHLRAKGLVR